MIFSFSSNFVKSNEAGRFFWFKTKGQAGFFGGVTCNNHLVPALSANLAPLIITDFTKIGVFLHPNVKIGK